MNDLAQRGIDCFLVEMPFNLAFLDMNAASSILDVPADGSYERWFLAGHSLGGAMAANYAADHPKQLSGLVLLAAYPTKSLQTAGFPVLSIYGSNDGVVNRSRIEEGRSLMPPIYEELVIEGGNHAQFGSYGAQDGDGEALISPGSSAHRRPTPSPTWWPGSPSRHRPARSPFTARSMPCLRSSTASSSSGSRPTPTARATSLWSSPSTPPSS